MGENVVDIIVGVVGVAILFGGKTDQSFTVDVDSERVVAGDHDVDTHVKFVPK